MGKHLELKERREANEFATNEFNRVKRAKLELERSKSLSGESEKKEEKQKDRERANRASAAASRAKIVFYCKELEKRTDRLELERNREASRAERATRKLKTLREEVCSLKKILRDLWAMKDQKTCSFLVDSGALFLLASRQEETGQDDNESDAEQNEDVWNKTRQVDSSAETSIQQANIITPIPKQQPQILPVIPQHSTMMPTVSVGQKRQYQVFSQPSIPVQQQPLPVMPKIRHLIHPTSQDNPNTRNTFPPHMLTASTSSQQMTNNLPPCTTQPTHFRHP